MRKIFRLFLLSVSFTLCLSASIFGQSETGQISGTVSDSAGAVIPGATVIAKSTRTGLTRTVTTNGDGYFVISNVQPSTYEVTINSGSFQEFKVTREVSVAGDVVINAALSVSAGQAVVDVTTTGSDIAEVNTTDQTISEVVGNKQVQNLPTVTRDPYQFVQTIGNVSNGDNGGRGAGVSINGQRSASTSVLLNGGENVDAFTSTIGQSVPLDSVQEYRVTTGTFGADFGRATGGVINLITKSGANQFFGTAYAFNRNSKFASAGYAANATITATDRANGVEPRQYFNRNQFGGSLGGPIFKDKLLFFTNTEFTRIRSTGSLTALVPSAASIAAAAPATRAFLANYTLAATRTGIQRSLAGTSRTLVFDEVRYSVPTDTGAGTPTNGYQSVTRLDYNVTNKFQIYGIYSLEKNDFFAGTNANSPYAGFNTGSKTNNQNIQGTATYSISNNLVSVTRFTYNRLFNEQPLGDQPSGPTLYLRTSTQRIAGTGIAFPGYLPFSPGSAIPFGGPQRLYNLAQEINYIAGNHVFKFGGQYYNIQDDRAFGAYQNAVETLALNNNATAVDNFFNGTIAQFQAAINPQGRFPGQTVTLPVSFPQFFRNNRYKEFNLYGNDSFKMFPGFTANIGLRYEYYGPQRNTDPNLDSNFYFGGDGSFSAANVRTGSVQIAPNSPVGELWKVDKNNFGPSVGFAYDIEGDGRTSLRAGYALRYERNFGNVTFNVIQNPPNYAVLALQGAFPITLNNAGPLGTGTGTATLPATSLRAVNPNIVNAFVHQYSAALERRFGQAVASATFSGSSGRNLYSIANINRRGSGLALLGSADTTRTCSPGGFSDRLNCQYGDINFRGSDGRSDYQGITFALESGNLFDAGLTMAARYTYAVAKDNLSTTFSETGNAFNLGYLDPYNPSIDYGFADFDIRHRFVANFVWELPTKKYFSNGVAKAIFSDFILSGQGFVQTGTPFSVYDCGGNTVSVCYRLIANGTVNYNGSLGADTGLANNFEFLNLANQSSVVIPGSATNIFPGENGGLPLAMTARNAFRGPGSWNVDMALSKKIYFGERVNLQLRIDAINLFNHANAGINLAETDISSSSVITANKSGRRQVQGGIRLSF